MHRHFVALFVAVIVLSAAYLFEPKTEKTALLSGPTSTTSTTSAESQAAKHYNWYKVARVVDGDTIVVLINGVETKIRLIGLDTPEIVDPRKTVQCFGKEASMQMHTLVDGTDVRLEYDPTQDALDKYGRTLAYVYVPSNSHPEGILVNRYMIEEGYGHEYTYRIPYKYQSKFKTAEREAREAKRGLWADNACN